MTRIELFSTVRLGLRRTLHGWRVLAVTTALLAAGVGCAAAVTSIAGLIVANPLGIPQLDRVMRTADGQLVSRSAFDEVRTRLSSVEVAGARAYEFPVEVADVPLRVPGQFVSPEYLRVLGVGDLLSGGKGIGVSAAFWRKHFGHKRVGHADDAPVTVRVHGWPLAIVTVAVPGFAGTSLGTQSDLFVPLEYQPLIAPELNTGGPDTRWLTLFARLSDAADRRTADSELLLRTPGITQGLPRGGLSWVSLGDVAIPARSRTTVHRTVALLCAIGLGVFALATCNAAVLLAWRADSRRGDNATAMALGASVARLRGETVVEAALATSATSLLSLAATAQLLRSFRDGRLGEMLPIPVEPQASYGTAAICVTLAAIGVGMSWLRPLLSVKAHTLSAVLAVNTTRVSSSRGWLRRLWLSAQAAFAVGALASSLALLGSLSRQYSVPWGFAPDKMLVWIAPSGVGGPERLALFYRTLLDEVRSAPGVQGAALAAIRPFGGLRIKRQIRSATGFSEAYSNIVSPGYFSVINTPLLAGREFSRDDDAGIVVNRSLAVSVWGRESVVGEFLSLADDGPQPLSQRVIGVVADTVYETPDERNVPVVYLPIAAEYRPNLFLHVRLSPSIETAAGVGIVRSLLRRTLRGDLRSDVEPYSLVLSRWTAQAEAIASVLGGLAALLLALTALGQLAVLAYLVSRRRRELAIRMALGASPIRLVGTVCVEACAITVVGAGAGLLLGHWMLTLLQGVLYEASAVGSVAEQALAVVALSAVCSLAAAWPAIRAARVEPARVLTCP
jgi:predicted permease